MINYNHLYYFYEIARVGNITLASKNLRTSQPSLSVQVKTLEDQLGVKLFFKKGRNIFLTPEGQKVYSHASIIFEIANDLISEVDKEKAYTKKKFNLYISAQIDSAFISDIIHGMQLDLGNKFVFNVKRFHPRVDLINDTITFRDGSVEESEDDIDLLLTSNEVINNKNLSHLRSIEVPVNLFKSTTHKVNESFLLMPSSNLSLRDETLLFLNSNKIKNSEVIFESDLISPLIRGVVNGLGVAYLPVSYMIEPMLDGLVIKNGPKNGYWKHRIHIYSKENLSKKKIAEEFIKKLLKTNII